MLALSCYLALATVSNGHRQQHYPAGDLQCAVLLITKEAVVALTLKVSLV